jgi:hypothetical protein
VRRLLGMFGITLAVAAGTLVPAAAAGASSHPAPYPGRFGVRLVDVPASEAKNPRALRYIIDFLRPGTVIHRRILVLNDEPRTAHLTVYADAARIRKGDFVGDAGATRSELTRWTRIRHRRVTLRPHSSVLDLVTIRVPRHATRGEHYGVIWVQQVARAHSVTGTAISEIARVGVRVYLAVGRGGAPPTSFAITSVSGHRTGQGQPVIKASVRNDGGRAIDLTGTALLAGGPGGTSAGPFKAQQTITLAPGQSGAVTFLPGRTLPAGSWQARISLASGLTDRTASAEVKLGVHPGGGPGLPVFLALGLLACLVIAIPFIRRRKPQAGRAHARPGLGTLSRPKPGSAS